MIKKYIDLKEKDIEIINNCLLTILLDINFEDSEHYNDILNVKHKLSTKLYDSNLSIVVENYIKEMIKNEN
ncbi:MAG: hypothetical protein LCH34_14280 [Firmicutes bacterium]|nr:hypothetical protein [Bacillota bacterium]